jgi:hypothetical protein
MADTGNVMGFRRIVTGYDQDGRSVVVDDGTVREGGAGNFDFWMDKPDETAGDMSARLAPQPFFPKGGQSFFRIFRIPSADAALSNCEIEAFAHDLFAGFGISECRVDTSRHPMMHRTPTTDYIVLLSGSISLLLDEGEPIALRPFDVVVQRATNHAWLNTGRHDAVLVAVLCGQD